MALADEPLEGAPAGEDDEDEQFGLGRGLGAILAPAGAPAPVEGRGLGALFGAEATRPPDATVSTVPSAPLTSLPAAAPPSRAAPPLPMLPQGARGGQVRPAVAPRGEEIDGHLATVTDRLDLDVALHVRPGPGGGRLTLHRPSVGSVPAPDLDRLCRAVRDFVARGRLTTDDLVVDRFACVVFGPRPLTEAGVYVFGRTGEALTLDERWAVHRHLAPAGSPT